MLDKYFVHIDGEEAKVLGIDQPIGEVVYQSGIFLVLKIKGHLYWSGRNEQAYGPAEYQVYRMVGPNPVSDDSNPSIECQLLFTFPTRKSTGRRIYKNGKLERVEDE